jgi:hypothetical protein
MVMTALFVIGAATALAACGSTAGATTTTAPVAPATSSSGTTEATVAATPNGNQLLQAAVEASVTQSPEAVQRILREVIDLPVERQHELSRLLDRTSLGAIVGAAKRIADRLDFITGLEQLLFNEESREELLERSQLHRIVAEETWVFGAAYALTVDDRSLTEVLDRHLQLLGRTREDAGEVRREDGRRGIVDLILSRRVPQPRDREHLVVELKRPNVELRSPEVQQIQDYAHAVSSDERFKDTTTRWRFWLVGNSMSAQAQQQVRQAGRPPGLLYQADDGLIEIWVRTWGQIIEDCRARLKFVEESLEYASSSEHALDYLRRIHEKYLPDTLASPSVAEPFSATTEDPPDVGAS